MPRTLFVVIIGCGRLGSHLANELSRAGHAVVVVDGQETSFANLRAEFGGFRVEGDASEVAVLKQAKIDKADLVIAATRGDNLNLMIALIAREIFGVKKVLARVYEPQRENLYRRLGIETLCPTLVAAEQFFRSLAEGVE